MRFDLCLLLDPAFSLQVYILPRSVEGMNKEVSPQHCCCNNRSRGKLGESTGQRIEQYSRMDAQDRISGSAQKSWARSITRVTWESVDFLLVFPCQRERGSCLPYPSFQSLANSAAISGEGSFRLWSPPFRSPHSCFLRNLGTLQGSVLASVPCNNWSPGQFSLVPLG